MTYRIVLLVVAALLPSAYAQGQSLTVAGGQTIRASTKHDYAAVELELAWKENIWGTENWRMDLNHAFNLAGFRDVNHVYLASWAPNLKFSLRNRGKTYPYFQVSFGAALMTDDNFESEDNDPRHTGTTDMGSHWQFVSSLTLGMVRNNLGFRARVYHYSNGELEHPNDGIDVAEFGISYRF